MILGNVDYIDLGLKSLPDPIQKAIKYLQETNFSILEKGKHSIQGEDMFAVITEYRTRPKSELNAESHKKYLDIHFVISGEEIIGVAPKSFENRSIREYSKNDDSTLYNEVKNEVDAPILTRNYAILFPEEIHRPGCDYKGRGNVKKAIVKVSVDLLEKSKQDEDKATIQSLKENVIAVIPARGGSKGIPRKNIKLLAGKPLIAYSIEKAKQSELVDRVIVSTEDEEIAEIARKYGAEVQIRPEELARDNIATPPVLQHVVKTLEAENYFPQVIVLLHPTSPLKKTRHIDEAVKKIRGGYDAVLSYGDLEINPVCIFEVDSENKVLVNDKGYATRQTDKKFIFNGAVYAYTPETLAKLGDLLWQKEFNIGLIKMTREESLEIDEPLDFEIVESLIKKRKELQ